MALLNKAKQVSDRHPHYLSLSHNLPPQSARTTEYFFCPTIHASIPFRSPSWIYQSTDRRGKWTSQQADDRTEDREGTTTKRREGQTKCD